MEMENALVLKMLLKSYEKMSKFLEKKSLFLNNY